jgi:hypothetical protein
MEVKLPKPMKGERVLFAALETVNFGFDRSDTERWECHPSTANGMIGLEIFKMVYEKRWFGKWGKEVWKKCEFPFMFMKALFPKEIYEMVEIDIYSIVPSYPTSVSDPGMELEMVRGGSGETLARFVDSYLGICAHC